MEPDFQTALNDCIALQKQLKDQYLLLTTEQDQKESLDKKLSSSLQNYYRNLVHLDYLPSDKSQGHKNLFEDEGLGDCYIFIKQVVLTLAKNPKLMLAIIKKHNNWQKTDSFQGVVHVIVDSMYENVVDDEIGHKDILRLLDGLLEMVTHSHNHLNNFKFEDKTLVYYVLEQFMRKAQFQTYATDIVKSSMLEIAKLDRLIDFTLLEEDDIKSIRKLPSKKFDSPPKKTAITKPVYQIEKIMTKVETYSQAFRKKDAKIRTSASIRTKNRNCVSNDLLKYLGIDDNISFPVFLGPKMEEIPQEEVINKEQWELLLNKKDTNTSSTGPDVPLLKNLIFMFFGDLFKRLYSMPPIIRVICKILYNYMFAKFKNRKECLNVVGNFVIGFWILGQMRFDDDLIETGKISDYTRQNTRILRKAIMAIVLKDRELVNSQFHSQLNIILTNLRISLFNYLTELINIDVPDLSDSAFSPQNSSFIKNFSVCLSIADISRFLEMIKHSRDALSKDYEKLLKKVDRIYQMSEGTNIFGSRKDKHTDREYQPSQAYVLFSELTLPKDLSFDYSKFYNDSFRKDKVKNVFRQVLLSIGDLSQADDFPIGCTELRDLFQYILSSRQQKMGLHSIDRIPIELKIKYLLILTKQIKIEELIDKMRSQATARLHSLQRVWDLSKQCYLKAIYSVIEQNQKIAFTEHFVKEQNKRIKLQQFMDMAKINLCLTSPKTREKEIILKSNMVKEIPEDERDKIWVQNQSRCIHTALRLEYIKSLTGQADKSKIKYETDVNNVQKFADIFCSLPEVKEKGMGGEDSYGIKDALDTFIKYCIEMIKNDKEYSILTEDMDWLEENLEQRVTKRIYEKLYPKMPTYDDLGLYFRLKTLDWVTYDNLKIEQLMQVDGMWDIAAKNLKQIDKMKTASQKLNTIRKCSKIISKSFSLVRAEDQHFNAEDIFPIVVYVLIKAAPRRLKSNLNFIQMFGNKEKLSSMNGYFFTQLKSAVMYCERMSHTTLGVEMVDFNCQIYQKQIDYGIYFLLRRRKDSPRTTLNKIDFLKKHYFCTPQTQCEKQIQQQERDN